LVTLPSVFHQALYEKCTGSVRKRTVSVSKINSKSGKIALQAVKTRFLATGTPIEKQITARTMNEIKKIRPKVQPENN
jgi:hypothetical protein